jgi:hypothetical protein
MTENQMEEMGAISDFNTKTNSGVAPRFLKHRAGCTLGCYSVLTMQ